MKPLLNLIILNIAQKIEWYKKTMIISSQWTSSQQAGLSLETYWMQPRTRLVEIPLLLVSAAAADKRKINWVCAAGAATAHPNIHPTHNRRSLFHLQKRRRRTNVRCHRAPDSGGKSFCSALFWLINNMKGSHTKNKN